MDKQLLAEVMVCLPQERTLFRYARCDYALMLLSRVARDGLPIAVIRRSVYCRLLDKPEVQALLAEAGSGIISHTLFDYAYVKGRQDFLLTLGCWNENRSNDNQTSRHSGNLALQLNLNTQHDREFSKVVGPAGKNIFENWGHPVNQYRC